MTKSAPAIVVKGKAFDQDNLLFDTLDIEIPAGQWTCLLGPSGVGKSTLLRLIAGLDTHVTFDGVIEASDGEAVSHRVSYMAQSDLLLPWASIRENITLGSRLRGERANEDQLNAIVQTMGLTEHLDKFPSALSGGQRQRAALARTLMEDTPIVLLDEAFSALDVKTKFQMQELVCESLTGKTVLLVSHDPAEAVRLCNRIYVLHQHELHLAKNLQPPFPKKYSDEDVFALQNELLSRICEGEG